MKEIKINVPEGYEIDKENSTFECIKFKKLDNKPRSWSEYSAKYGSKEHYSISDELWGRLHDEFATMGEARAFAALGKLIQLRDAWWGDWRPDWTNSKIRYEVIETAKDRVIKGSYYTTIRVLAFPTVEMRDDFYTTFKDLIEEAKMFL